MESTETLMHDDVDCIHFWNSSTENITYGMDLEEHEEFSKFINLTSILIPVLFGLITIFGLVGNILTIAVILFHKVNRGITNDLILNLAIADLLYVIFCIPFKAIYSALHVWLFGDSWCRIHTYVEYICYFASMYILVLVSIDRYMALAHPIRAITLRTKRNCYIALVVLWSLVILGNIPFIFMAKEVNLNSECIKEESMVCAVHFEDATGSSIALFTFAYLLPLILLCILYGHMLKIFLTGKSPSEHSSGDHIRLQAKKRVTKMVILIVTAFAICWMPLQIIMLYIHVSPGEVTTVTFASIIYGAKCMAYMNSCINPILYAFYTNTFRRGIENMICGKKRRYTKSTSHSSVKRGSHSSTITNYSSVKRGSHSSTTTSNSSVKRGSHSSTITTTFMM